MGQIKNSYICSLDLCSDLIGGKWKQRIIWHLRNDTLRFSDLQKKLPGITHKMLSQELRDLENNSLINRKVYPEVPPKVEYSLTQFGIKVLPALELLSSWSKSYANDNSIDLK